MTLYEYVSCLNPPDTLLISNNGNNATEELVSLADVFRRNHKQLEDQSLALSCRDNIKLIQYLVALDGYCSRLILLPSSLNEEEKQQLIKKSECSFIIEDDQIDQLIMAAPMHQQTVWTLATSGTTGTPILIDHSLESLSRTVKQPSQKSQDFIWGLLYDPCRFAGLQVILQSLIGGNMLVFSSDNNFNSQVETLLQHQVNALSASPSLWRKMLIDGRIRQMSLRQITLGGEIADDSILNKLKSSFPDSRIIHIYASTEAGVGFAVTDAKAGFPANWLNKPKKDIHMKIGSNGNLLIKQSQQVGGKEVLQRIDEQGFLDTQDKVTQERDRILFLGRESGCINVGGNKVHPEEVENVIRELNEVADVRVYSKKNPIIGELVSADIMLSEEQEDKKTVKKTITEHCKTKLELYKIPALISFTSDLQISPAGKLTRTSS